MSRYFGMARDIVTMMGADPAVATVMCRVIGMIPEEGATAAISDDAWVALARSAFQSWPPHPPEEPDEAMLRQWIATNLPRFAHHATAGALP